MATQRSFAAPDGLSRTEPESTESQRFQPFLLKEVPHWKRGLDLLLLVLTLPITLPVWVFCACLIKVASPGPLFFIQDRVGYGRRRFRCYKFRTMHVGADTDTHQHYFRRLQDPQSDAPMRKMDAHDPRIIPFGRIIRALGFDELPQLINVFRGEMSFVGPRPCTPFELEKYQNGQMERFSALPGLTGLWQVKGKNRTTFARMIELDIAYSRTQSVFLDIKILALTPITLAMQLVDAFASRGSATLSSAPAVQVQVQGATDA